MAFLTGPPSRGKTPAQKGYYYVRQWRGQLVLCKWPRKRGRGVDPATKARNDDFKQANWLCRYLDARQIMTARNAAQGTPLMPRDLLVSAMYGRLYAFAREGGGTAFSRAMVSDVSHNLDIIGQTPGDLLARGTDGWEPVHGGDAGKVLTSQGPNQPPAWTAGGGGGGSRAMSVLPGGSASASAYATKGIFFDPLLPITAFGLIADFDQYAAGTYFATLASLSGNNIGTILAQSSPQTGQSGAGVRRWFPFPSSVYCTPGTEYALMLTRSDQGGTYALPLLSPTITIPPAPVSATFGYVRIATTAPAAGQASGRTVSAAVFTCNWLYNV